MIIKCHFYQKKTFNKTAARPAFPNELKVGGQQRNNKKTKVHVICLYAQMDVSGNKERTRNEYIRGSLWEVQQNERSKNSNRDDWSM